MKALATQLNGVGWASLVSLSVHGALALAVLNAPSGWLAGDQLAEPVEITILPRTEPAEIEPAPEPPPPEPQRDSRPEPPPSPETQPPLPPSRQEQVDPSPGEPHAPDAPPSEATATPPIAVPDVRPDEPHRQETDEQRERRQWAIINPHAAGRSGFVPTGPGPSQRGAPAGLGSTDDRRPTEEEIEAQHSGHLRARANARPWITREEPELHRQADGSYAYQGHAFAARIRPDGSVRFEDHGNVQTDTIPTAGSFDITDALMGASGQDPHRAEREWFYEHTEELRHRLEAEHRATVAASGLRRLPGVLARVWATTRRTTGARRRRLFSMWDDMAEDESGAPARRAVIDFIQNTIPEGHEDAYTEAELERLNASRQSTERFAPY